MRVITLKNCYCHTCEREHFTTLGLQGTGRCTEIEKKTAPSSLHMVTFMSTDMPTQNQRETDMKCRGYKPFSMKKRAQIVEYKLKMFSSETPEENIAIAVIVRAMYDFVKDEPKQGGKENQVRVRFSERVCRWKARHNSALEFLTGEMQTIDTCNIEPTWVHSLLKECGVITGSETKIV